MALDFIVRILWKTLKNCSGFLALQNNCTAGYFKRYDFEIFIKA